MNCPACNNESYAALIKHGTVYNKCCFCHTIFSDPLPNDNMVGGGFEEERNINQNSIREERMLSILQQLGQQHTAPILDFGCGHGMLMKYLIEKGFDCDGYDKFNPNYAEIDYSKKYQVVTMVEVIEHLSHPFNEIDTISGLLATHGILYIETSFIDVAKQENIPLEDFFYIDPRVGHSTIFSHLGLDILMLTKGFKPVVHINRNARLFQKTDE